jgi:hypothetical protein
MRKIYIKTRRSTIETLAIMSKAYTLRNHPIRFCGCWVYTFGYNKPKNYKKPYPEIEFFFNLNLENNDYEKK